jgi:hypothetical protein
MKCPRELRRSQVLSDESYGDRCHGDIYRLNFQTIHLRMLLGDRSAFYCVFNGRHKRQLKEGLLSFLFGSLIRWPEYIPKATGCSRPHPHDNYVTCVCLGSNALWYNPPFNSSKDRLSNHFSLLIKLISLVSSQMFLDFLKNIE